jgi:predicted N-acyltransferase
MSFELRTWSSMSAFGEEAYSELAEADDSPFTSYAWLDTLERAGCVAPERGWAPCHLSLHRDGKLAAFAPAYVKGNSEGEFVFDHSWARFSEASLGVSYYPKLIVAVPFTPATGSRLLVRAGEDHAQVRSAFAEGLRRVVPELGVSSAHVLFPQAAEADALSSHGFARRAGVQFQWHNAGYGSFDDFLERFSSKRRNQIRRERREVRANGIDIDVVSGSDLGPELADFVHEFYRSTVDKYFWGRPYLNREFFEEILVRLRDRVHLVVARDRGSGRRIAGAFNMLGKRALYGRYWGALEERNFVHFEVCFYTGIEQAILRRLDRFEPGAGGEHKLTRGFEPTETHSAHHLEDARLDRAVRDFLAREKPAVVSEIDAVRKEMRMKPAKAVSGQRS